MTPKKELITGEAIRQVLRSYGAEYKAHPWKTAASFILAPLGNIFVFYVPPLIVASIINSYVQHDHPALSSFTGQIALFGGAWLFGEILWRVGSHYMYRLISEGMRHLNDVAFKQIIHRDYDFYTDNFVGTLTKRVQSFSRGFESFSEILAYNIIGSIFPIVFAFIVLSRYSYVISLVLIASIVLVAAVAIPLTRMRAPLVAERQDAGSKTTGRLSDALTNILAIKSFAKEDKEEEIYGEHVDTFNKAYIKAFDFQNMRIYSAISPLYVLSNVAGLAAVMYFSGQAGLPAGTILLVFTYYSNVTQIFWNIQSTYRQIEGALTEAAEFTHMLALPATITDAPDATPLRVTECTVSFRDVEFAYKGQKEDATFLNNFNVSIKGHERVGLVGPSGGGKTTITKLLLRFLDPQSGQISIDGMDIKHATQHSLRESISYVPQEPLLFHRSLFENIAYGKDDVTEEEVIAAAKLAHAHEFIETLPDKYQTLVGERGVKLSGGQRQRVAIARALLKNAPLLILDEATSSLDSESEKYIQDGLWELMKGKTALVIAHRLSTIKHLDRILVLDKGQIVQDGTHEELIHEDGIYKMLWGHQSGEFLTES